MATWTGAKTEEMSSLIESEKKQNEPTTSTTFVFECLFQGHNEVKNKTINFGSFIYMPQVKRATGESRREREKDQSP